MAKTVNQLFKKIPVKEIIMLTFDNLKGQTYIITKGKDAFYLYGKTETGYKYLKSRKKDPCFYECY